MSRLIDIAKKAGVSIRTVSRVLKNERHISSAKKEKVEKALKILNYTPNWIAQSLKTKRSNLLGVLVNQLSLEVMAKKVSAIQKNAALKGYRTILGITYGKADLESKFIAEFNQFCDGLLFLNQPEKQNHHITKPFLWVDCFIDKLPDKIPSVLLNRQAGVIEAMAALRKKYNLFYFLTSTPQKKEFRRTAFIKTCKKSNLPFKIIQVSEKKPEAWGGFDVAKTIKMNTKTLCFCYNDRIALGLLKGLKENNIEIPNQVGILGFDNDQYTEFTSPALSTISQSEEILGQMAVETLYDHIQKKKGIKNKTVKTKFIQREST